jgi:acetyltransferase-like isoleucine patch superfamily enzyme
VDRSPDGLRGDLAALDAQLRADMRARFDRDLPFFELVEDRWNRARSLGFGEGASIYASAYVFGDVRVGAGTWIGPLTLLDGSGAGLTIGSHCSVSAGVQIYTHDTVRRSLSGGTADIERAPVTIGDCTYIGAQAVIAKGVTIGDHVVIGASSFVNRDVEPFTIAVGTPCRRIGTVVLGPEDEIELVYDQTGVAGTSGA